MKNIKLEVKNNTLTITVDLSQEQGISGSGKSMMIASTEGNVAVPGKEDIKVGLNIYKPVKR